MTPHDLDAALVRTTLATSAAACLAVVLLGLLRIQSPRTHRLAWLLVILQGWLLIPWTLQLESPPAPPQPAPQGAMPTSAWAWEQTETTQAIVLVTEPAPPPRSLASARSRSSRSSCCARATRRLSSAKTRSRAKK